MNKHSHKEIDSNIDEENDMLLDSDCEYADDLIVHHDSSDFEESEKKTNSGGDSISRSLYEKENNLAHENILRQNLIVKLAKKKNNSKETEKTMPADSPQVERNSKQCCDKHENNKNVKTNSQSADNPVEANSGSNTVKVETNFNWDESEEEEEKKLNVLDRELPPRQERKRFDNNKKPQKDHKPERLHYDVKPVKEERVRHPKKSPPSRREPRLMTPQCPKHPRREHNMHREEPYGDNRYKYPDYEIRREWEELKRQWDELARERHKFEVEKKLFYEKCITSKRCFEYEYNLPPKMMGYHRRYREPSVEYTAKRPRREEGYGNRYGSFEERHYDMGRYREERRY